jgi:hypothetical protein
MKRQQVEKKIVVLLFVSVIILFSMAQKDSQKVKQLYTGTEKMDKKSARLELAPTNFSTK